ncbi:MAG: hypothetical protein AAGI30_04885 [Planctomycetota bacterium]
MDKLAGHAKVCIQGRPIAMIRQDGKTLAVTLQRADLGIEQEFRSSDDAR